jgi:hypothetical protein
MGLCFDGRSKGEIGPEDLLEVVRKDWWIKHFERKMFFGIMRLKDGTSL